jgi:hypothetical protein
VLRSLIVLAGVGACSAPGAAGSHLDASAAGHDAAVDVDATGDVPLAGFGQLSGMCGVLSEPQLTGPTPVIVRDTFTFERAYVDAVDRPLLTPGGRRLAETPNAGGSSGLSEVFAYEQLARCELAMLLKTETEIVYDQPGKITDFQLLVDGYPIGVSVTRAVAYPFGEAYTVEAATVLLARKLGDIQLSTANVSAADRWRKQILAVLAWDDQAADVVMQAWAALDAEVQADTIVVITSTVGADTFIYTNN